MHSTSLSDDPVPDRKYSPEDRMKIPALHPQRDFSVTQPKLAKLLP
jgi:hypothetical protein